MNADLTAMQEAIRTLADAVDGLSKMCEGLPKFLENQIGTFRAEMHTALTGAAEKAEANRAAIAEVATKMETRVAELASNFEVTKEALMTSVEAVGQRADQIIADNRAAIELSITAGDRAVVETLGKELSGLTAKIDEARSACDTVDLHHGLALVKGDIEGHNKILSEMSVAIDAGNKVAENLTKTVADIGRDLLAVPDKIGAAVGAADAAVRATLADSEAKQAEGTRTYAAMFGERLDGLQGQLVKAEAGLTSMLQSAEQRSAEALTAAVQKLEATDLSIGQDALARFDRDDAALASHKGAIETLEHKVAALSVDLPNIVSTTKEELEAGIGEVRTAVKGAEKRIDSLSELLDTDEAMLKSLDAGLAGLDVRLTELAVDIPNVVAGVKSELEASIAVVETAAKSAADGVGAATVLITELDGNVKALRGETVDFATKTTEKLLGVDQRLHDITTAHGVVVGKADQLSASLGSLQTQLETQVTDVRSILEGTTERIGSVYVELEAKVAGVANAYRDERALDNAELEKRIKDVVEFVKLRVTESVQGLALAVDIDKAFEDAAKTYAEQWLGAVATIDDLSKTVDILESRLAEVPNLLSTFEDKIKAIEPGITPEQMAELHVRLAAQLPEVAPPVPEFQIRYDEGGLQVTLEYEHNGEKKSSVATVPVNIGVQYRGVYRPDQTYPAGHMVSHKGSVWASTGTVIGEPGKDFTGWKLAVKRGADGKSPEPIRTYTSLDPRNVYKESDFLRINNRLWQCAVKETRAVPEPGDIQSTPEWLLIGGVQ